MDYRDQKIIDKLVTARIALLLKHPFFGNLATRLKLVNADDWCPTAGTDGRHFYYNTKFIDSLSPREAEFLFGHEVLHNVFEHMMVRIGDRDPQLWNIAADYAVNQILKDSGIGEMPTGKKGENKGFQDEKYKDWPAERIYDDLFKQAKKNGKKALEKMGQLMDNPEANRTKCQRRRMLHLMMNERVNNRRSPPGDGHCPDPWSPDSLRPPCLFVMSR